MPKVIAIQNELKNVGKTLESIGYEVVDENYDGYVDAILYNSDYSQLGYLGNFDSVIDMDKGAIVVNTRNKSIDEIVYAIEKRTYEPLF